MSVNGWEWLEGAACDGVRGGRQLAEPNALSLIGIAAYANIQDAGIPKPSRLFIRILDE